MQDSARSNVVSARVLESITEIDSTLWDACVPVGNDYNPFLSHKFLCALELSDSATAATGWKPFHLVVEHRDDLLGVIPLYLKNHSQGEYVFDYSWADAWHRAGGDYYPKLQSCIPFTPASGPRLLCHRNHSDARPILLSACTEIAEKIGVSSVHITFMEEPEWGTAADYGFLQRMDQQFHWLNSGYATFDDFLADLASKKRKNLKRERRDALSNGIEIDWLTGPDLREEHWDAFYQFYLDTGARKWGTPYLTRDFFSRIHQTMPSETLLIMAKREGRYIAGALNFIGGNTLFGRNWGCLEDHRFLHFEVCYYQAIDFAISRGLAKVEAGAQGGHKVARGYLPCATYSAHWIADAQFRDAVTNFLQRERDYVAEDIADIETRSPFNSTIDIGALRQAARQDTPLSTEEELDPSAQDGKNSEP